VSKERWQLEWPANIMEMVNKSGLGVTRRDEVRDLVTSHSDPKNATLAENKVGMAA